jgi:energy-coupling factor transporter transmembrane protein EcfT
MIDDVRQLEFLAVNSKEVVEKQVDSYRQQHSYAGTIIGAIALYIPFFISSLTSSFLIIQFIMIIPTLLFILVIFLMLSIFTTKPLDQAANVTKYKDLLEKSYKEILLFEINANAYSYTINKKVTEKGNRRYAIGVKLTTIALVFSIVLISVNKFMVIEKPPIKIQVVNKIKR